MTDLLLETKFHIPHWRSGGIHRHRLTDKLITGLNESRKLALISAPAGYGKTTVIVEWLNSLDDNTKVAWLSLEESDNDPIRFTTYLVSTMQKVEAFDGATIKNLLAFPQPPPLNSIFDEILNKVLILPNRIVLVLDDYHVIKNPEIHGAMEYFLDHLPPSTHVAITTREDPPFPLARLRARSLLTEIRASDLRFTIEEALQFFNLSMGLNLPEETILQLDARVEGWAAGMQLAALALQSLPNHKDFIARFSGSHRYIIDYLLDEVLKHQSIEIQQFLNKTSILHRFNSGLCQEVTGNPDAPNIISRLDHLNLFLIPLDENREWYRYHHLFADVLRVGLAHSDFSDLNKLASAWHSKNNLPLEAVRYALATRDSEFTADIIEHALINDTTWSAGNVDMLSSWLDALPEDVFRTRPQLSLNASRILYLLGRFDLAEKRIAQTVNLLTALPVTTETEQMLAMTNLYRGCIASVRGDAHQAIKQITNARSILSEAKHLAHARGLFGLALAYEVTNQTSLAVDHYLLASEEAKTAGVAFLAVHAACAAAQVQISQGKLNLAQKTCNHAIELAKGEPIPPTGLAWIILGGISLERNILPQAKQFIQDGIKLSRQGGLLDDVILGLSYLSRIYAIQGNQVEAYGSIHEVESIIQAFKVPRMSLLLKAHIARIQLALGDNKAAARWAEEYQSKREAIARIENVELTLARILLASGNLDSILSILEPVLEKAQATGQNQTSIEAMILLGLFDYAKKDIPSAKDWLNRVILLAEPEGYIRIFIDEGKHLADLLNYSRETSPQYVDKLLAMGEIMPASISAPNNKLPDPLSEQELRVLRLIVAGRSNREIANELVISVGTAKWHVHNILQKLGVNNRPRAIALVRELGIE